jgi:hypothetical protein
MAFGKPEPSSNEKCSDWHKAVSQGSIRERSFSGPKPSPLLIQGDDIPLPNSKVGFVLSPSSVLFKNAIG